jgi:phosphatidylethanolamine/phosphatidyl-N-methylethanolamine N-methyltransferase
MQPTELSKEGELFFRQYLRSPRSVGSVIPSSRALGRGVAAETAWEPGRYVVELGGGTGSITMGLIERGIPRDRLMVIELDGPLHAYLKERLPGVRVIQGDATRLDEILQRHGIDDVATVISGVPMVGNPISLRRAIVEQGFKVLRPGGFMLQYSYSPVAPIPAKDFGVTAKLVRYVFWNFPPATVWKYTRDGDSAPS